MTVVTKETSGLAFERDQAIEVRERRGALRMTQQDQANLTLSTSRSIRFFLLCYQLGQPRNLIIDYQREHLRRQYSSLVETEMRDLPATLNSPRVSNAG